MAEWIILKVKKNAITNQSVLLIPIIEEKKTKPQLLDTVWKQRQIISSIISWGVIHTKPINVDFLNVFCGLKRSDAVTYLKFIEVVDTVWDDVPISKLGSGSLDKTNIRWAQACLGNKVFSERLDSTCHLLR